METVAIVESTTTEKSKVSCDTGLLITNKLKSITDYIESQNLPFTPSFVLELRSLEDAVNLVIAIMLQDQGTIKNIFTYTFETNPSVELFDFCREVGVGLHVLNIDEDVEVMSNLVSIGIESITTTKTKDDTWFQLKNDMSRGILYTIALRSQGMVLSGINASDREVGNYQKTYQKCGDLDFVGNWSHPQLLAIAEALRIPLYFRDQTFKLANFLLKHGFDYFSMFDVEGHKLEDNKLSEPAIVFCKKNLHNLSFVSPAVECEYTLLESELGDDIYENKDTYTSPYEIRSVQLKDKLRILRKREKFSAAKWVETMVTKIAADAELEGFDTLINGASGGVDSGMVFKLSKKVQELYPNVIKRVVAVTMPIYSTEEIQNRAHENVGSSGEVCVNLDLSQLWRSLCAKVYQVLGIDSAKLTEKELGAMLFTDGCFKSSLRANALYEISRRVGKAIVMGTGNKSEDKWLAYFAKSGDGLVDKSYIASLYKHYIILVAKYLGVVQSILVAQPSADLVPGQTDEDELKASYEFVELLMRILEMQPNEAVEFISDLNDEAREEFDKTAELVTAVHNKNKHKFTLALVL